MTSDKKIVHLSTAHPATDNRIFRKECTAMADAGYNVTLVAQDTKATFTGPVQHHPLPHYTSRLQRVIRGPFSAWRALRHIRPDLIIGHDPELIPLLVVYRSTHRGTKLVYDAHEHLPKQIASKTYIPHALRPVLTRAARALEVMADRYLDSIIVATPHIEESFSPEKRVLVQNFPWLRDFPAPTAYPTTQPARVCYVGGLSRDRGIETMIKLPERTSMNVQLDLAGPTASDALPGVNAPGVNYFGVLTPDQVPALIANCSIGLALLRPLPNYLESQATKIFEYMAAARPFIASDFASWEAQFAPFACGLFVDPEDADAAAEAIDQLTSNPDGAKEMGLRGRDAVEQKFNFENEARALLDMVDRLIGQ